MKKAIPRLIESSILQSLKAFPVVYIAGPRQSGKTTLVKQIASHQHPAQYITFDDEQMRLSVRRDPEAFLRAFDGPVVLDEIQLVPEIFRPLKIIVDENRQRKDGGRGRFLLTGSASVMALPQLSDALVGRMVLHTLPPFSLCELQTPQTAAWIDFAFAATWKTKAGEINIQEKNSTPNKIIQTMMQGSFPEVSRLTDAVLRDTWCDSYMNTLLQRDVRALVEIEKVGQVPHLLRLLATRTGGLLNEASLSRDTELNHITLKRYRILLENLFLLQSVPAWAHNLGKRLIKTPKIYISDINLLTYLLNAQLESIASINPMLFGQILENFVAVELNKQLSFSKVRANLYHYRTTARQEVDFLLEGPLNRIVGIEVKARSKINNRDFSHLEALKQDLGDKFLRGFVFYQGKETIPFGKDLWAVPVSLLWGG